MPLRYEDARAAGAGMRLSALAASPSTPGDDGAWRSTGSFRPTSRATTSGRPKIVDANGRLLRAFTTTDGMWRLKTTVDDVDPVYLALLKAYEDSRFALHPGVDLLVGRATGQLIAHGRIVSGASTITMQAARLLEPAAAAPSSTR